MILFNSQEVSEHFAFFLRHRSVKQHAAVGAGGIPGDPSSFLRDQEFHNLNNVIDRADSPRCRGCLNGSLELFSAQCFVPPSVLSDSRSWCKTVGTPYMSVSTGPGLIVLQVRLYFCPRVAAMVRLTASSAALLAEYR